MTTSHYAGCFDGTTLDFFSDDGAGHEMVRISPDSAGGIVVSYWRDARIGGTSDGDGWFSADWMDGEVAGIDGSDPLLVAACEAWKARACTWCQRPATDLVVELDEQVPACEDCTWAHENEPSDQDAHDHYQDVCDRNARLLTTYSN